MKFSIITVVKNNKDSIKRAAASVKEQSYKNYEHIVVDGASTNGTLELIKEFADEQTKWISEPDNGIYDAINKGIKMATGDVIGLLHSDDMFADEGVLERYADAFLEGYKEYGVDRERYGVEAVYSDLVYVRKSSKFGVQSSEFEVRSLKFGVQSSEFEVRSSGLRNQSFNHSIIQSFPALLPANYSVLRYWKAHAGIKDTDNRSLITDNLLKKGWMPPHPTLFVRKEVFEKYGLYRTDMKIAADYEMILRLFYKHKITSYYLPHTTYLMSTGGASNKSIKNIMQKSKEDFRALKLHNTGFPLITLFLKNVRKVPQFL